MPPRPTPAASALGADAHPATPAPSTAASAAPTGQVIDYRALAGAGGSPIGFLDSRGQTGEVNRADLLCDALAAAAGLARHGLRPGSRVILLLPTGPDHLTVLFACLLSGVVPCTVAAPTNPNNPGSAGIRHLRAAATAVRPAAVISAEGWCEAARSATAATGAGPVLSAMDLQGVPAVQLGRLPGPDPDAVHHIQLTSGSTSTPRAVVLTHRAVAANLAALAAATGLCPDRDRLSSWLPLYHDMGLVQVLLALGYGAGLDLMPPVGFLRDPLCWLRHIGQRRATLTAAPPFAYRTVADRQLSRPVPGLDLSRLRQAYVGAEPLPVTALRRFRDTFAPAGLSDDALVPCYGMAETVLAATVALDTGPAPHRLFGRVRARALDRPGAGSAGTGSAGTATAGTATAGTATAGTGSTDAGPTDAGPACPGSTDAGPTGTAAAGRTVSCGQTVGGLTVRITGPDGLEAPAGAVGSVHLRGASLMAGYLTPTGLDRPPDGWHDSGDLGRWVDGELYLVGRSKEMLIIRGRNLPPYDVESVIEEHPRVGTGHSVVFSYPTDDQASEPVVAVVETATPARDWPWLRVEVATAVRQVFGLSLAEVVVLPRAGIPRTSSGKRQRSALREAYLDGRLG